MHCQNPRDGHVLRSKKSMIVDPGRFSSPLEITDGGRQTNTSPKNKRQMNEDANAISYPEKDATDGSGMIKTIRLLVSKQELREILVSNRMSIEELIMLAGSVRRSEGVDFARRWQPLLETIPEAEGSE